MASFDKKTTSSGAGKKPLLAAGLAVVLAVLVVRHFTKAQPADAAVPTDLVATPVEQPEETTAEARAKLAEDPTAKWLLAGREEKSDIDTPPSDPFQMSPEWRSSLLKPAPAVSNTTVAIVPTHTPEPVKSTGPAWDPSGIKLQGVFKDSRRSFAIVNGSIVTEGMIIGNARILEVRESSLLVSPLGSDLNFEVMLKSRPK